NLAMVHQAQGKYAEAEAVFKRALAIREQALGASHPDVAHALRNLANVYRDQGKHAQAEGLYKRALAIQEHLQTVVEMGVMYDRQGKYAEAEGLYQRALAGLERALGADHPRVAQT